MLMDQLSYLLLLLVKKRIVLHPVQDMKLCQPFDLSGNFLQNSLSFHAQHLALSLGQQVLEEAAFLVIAELCGL